MNGNDKNIAAHEADFQPAAIGAEVPQRGLLQVIWERRWIVILAAFACLAAGMLYLLKATPIYTSTSRLVVEQRGPTIISASEGIMTRSKNYLYTQREIIKSEPILAAVLEQPGVRRMKTFSEVDNLIIYLQKKLTVEVGKKDDLISISLDSAYPEEAAQIVNATVDSYVSDRSMHQRASAADVLKLLQKGKATSDTELTDKLQAMLEFKKKEGALSFETDKGNIVFQQLAKLSDALTSAQLDTIDIKAAYQAAQAMIDDPAKIKHLVEAQRGKGVYISFSREEEVIRADLNKLQVKLVALRQE
ncbi:MAG: hypothetical protein KAT11_07615, partial [Phycisphaerae bacterium]|nr:hypothetical protein [Phycisphaerae bacterium]